MTMDAKANAPYAPVANVLTVVRRFRERGLPNPLNFQELERLGVPSGNVSRTLAALRFLDLVDEEGNRTSVFEDLGRASTSDYPPALAEVLRNAYASVFVLVDPAVDSEIQLHDAFRHFQPQAQRERMVTLFLGLCQEAGIVPGGPPERRPRRRQSSKLEPTSVSIGSSEPSMHVHAESDTPLGVDLRLISALMQQLPSSGKWTQVRRDKWIDAVGAAVDLLFEVADDGDRNE